jgi:hypothetical protein
MTDHATTEPLSTTFSPPYHRVRLYRRVRRRRDEARCADSALGSAAADVAVPGAWAGRDRGSGSSSSVVLRRGPAEINVARARSTATRLVTAHVQTPHTPTGVMTTRRPHLCEVTDTCIH